MKWVPVFAILALSLLVPAPPASAEETLSPEAKRILRLDLDELTREARRVLDARYPDEDWARFDFPEFVFRNESSAIAYKIAAREPRLLGLPGSENALPCYCFCESIGHASLLACFWKDGVVGGEYDDHGAWCTICYGEAMIALLLDDAGASPSDILEAMAEKFADLAEKHQGR